MKNLEIKTECNYVYCPKCKKMHNDTKHKTMLRLNVWDGDSCMIEHEFHQDPETMDDSSCNLCKVCGSTLNHILSESMYYLVTLMDGMGFDILDIENGFNVSMSGVNNFKYVVPYKLAFTVPVAYRQEFAKLAPNVTNSKFNTIKMHNTNEWYDAILENEYAMKKFYEFIKLVVSSCADNAWEMQYVPKIISELVLKGYQVNGTSIHYEQGEEIREYKVSLLDTSMIDTSRESANSTVGLGIHVENDGIYFSDYSVFPGVYLKWIKNLPDAQ